MYCGTVVLANIYDGVIMLAAGVLGLLTLAEDGSEMRVDSSRHTGLFGSESTMNMKRNLLVLDTDIDEKEKKSSCIAQRA